MFMITDMLGPVDLYYAMPRGLDNVYHLGLRIFRDELGQSRNMSLYVTIMVFIYTN